MIVGSGGIDEDEIAIVQGVFVLHVVERVGVLAGRHDAAVPGPVTAESTEGAIEQRLYLVLGAAGRGGFHRFAVGANADLRGMAQQADLHRSLLLSQLGDGRVECRDLGRRVRGAKVGDESRAEGDSVRVEPVTGVNRRNEVDWQPAGHQRIEGWLQLQEVAACHSNRAPHVSDRSSIADEASRHWRLRRHEHRRGSRAVALEHHHHRI